MCLALDRKMAGIWQQTLCLMHGSVHALAIDVHGSRGKPWKPTLKFIA